MIELTDSVRLSMSKATLGELELASLRRLAKKYKVDESGDIVLRYGPKAGTYVSDKTLAIEILNEGGPIGPLLELVMVLMDIIRKDVR